MKKSLMLASLILIISLKGMEAPSGKAESCGPQTIEQEIDPSIASKFAQEENKFKKYDLDHPEKFLEKLRRALNKDNDPLMYLANLNRFASFLLLQDLTIKQIVKKAYIRAKFVNFYKESNDTLKTISVGECEDVFYFSPPSETDLTEVLTHSELLKESLPNTQKIREMIFAFILDPSKSKWINEFGKNRKVNLQMWLISPLLTKEIQKNHDFYNAISWDELLKKKGEKIALVDENIDAFLRWYTNVDLRALQLQTGKQLKISEGAKTSERLKAQYAEEKKIVDLYFKVQPWYQKLYRVVRRELDAVLKSLKEKDVKEYVNALKYLKPSTALENQKVLPSILPESLDTIIRPSDDVLGQIAQELQLIEKELEQAKIEWGAKSVARAVEPQEKIGERQKAKPKIYRRRKPAGTLGIQEEETVEEATEQRKLKEAIDGSFIAEGDETDKLITIHNPKNNTEEIIYKTDKPYNIKESLPAINYTKSIQMWFDEPDKARELQGYNDPKNKRYRAGEPAWKPVVLHAFSRLIDDYILQWGTKIEVPSRLEEGRKDWLISIPGAIVYPDGTKETGVYAYLIDSNNKQWYHRMFEPQSAKKLVADFAANGYFSPEMKGYYDAYFPVLGKGSAVSSGKLDNG